MKLRIRGNSIRLRLGESEVALLAKAGRVADSIQFSSSAGLLTYAIVTSTEAKEITAQFADNEIKVTVPGATTKDWANSAQVGLERVQPINGELELAILIEKDFRCLAPRPGEDQSDSFANPAQGRECTPH